MTHELIFKAVLPLIVLVGTFLILIRSSRNSYGKMQNSVEKQTEEMQKLSNIAQENLDLMRRQVAALEEIAKKP